jgi:hypothetical protein
MGEAFDSCQLLFGKPCACLVVDEGDSAAKPDGAIVTLDVCSDYRAKHPSSVVCRDRSWGVLE